MRGKRFPCSTEVVSGPDQHHAAAVAGDAEMSCLEPSCGVAKDHGDHLANGRRHFRFHCLAAAVVHRTAHRFWPGDVTPAGQIRGQYHLRRGAAYALGHG